MLARAQERAEERVKELSATSFEARLALRAKAAAEAAARLERAKAWYRGAWMPLFVLLLLRQ